MQSTETSFISFTYYPNCYLLDISDNMINNTSKIQSNTAILLLSLYCTPLQAIFRYIILIHVINGCLANSQYTKGTYTFLGFDFGFLINIKDTFILNIFTNSNPLNYRVHKVYSFREVTHSNGKN